MTFSGRAMWLCKTKLPLIGDPMRYDNQEFNYVEYMVFVLLCLVYIVSMVCHT
jgi:hypothetical protein